MLVVTRIDRLARSIGDLQDIVRLLKSKGVVLKTSEQPIDTGGRAYGRPRYWLRRPGFAPTPSLMDALVLELFGCALDRDWDEGFAVRGAGLVDLFGDLLERLFMG